jgi:hypothetical protein
MFFHFIYEIRVLIAIKPNFTENEKNFTTRLLVFYP